MTGCVRLLRSLLCAAFFTAFGLGSLLFSVFLLLPVSRPVARGVQHALFSLFVWLGKVTRLFVVEATPEDRARFKGFRGSVIVSNHITLIDFVILVSLLGDTVCVTKEAVGRNPFMRIIARKILVVNTGTEDVLRQSRQYLEEGVNVLVFPEGTRTPATDAEHVFRRGAAHLALAAGAPVETLFIACDPPVLGKCQPWWEVGDRTIRYSFAYKGRIAASPSVPLDDYAAQRRRSRELTQQMRERVFAA